MNWNKSIGIAFLGIFALALYGCDAPASKTDSAQVNQESNEANEIVPEEVVFEYEGQADFETWATEKGAEVLSGVAESPDGSASADLLILGEGGAIGKRFLDYSVVAGDTYSAKLWMWSEQNSRVAVQLVRWCSNTAPEIETLTVTLSEEPALYELNKTFDYDHDCLRLQITGLTPEAKAMAWGYRLDKE